MARNEDDAFQDEQDAIGDMLDDRDGDHDGFGSHWDDRISAIEGYCDYCEREGHTFRSCPRRDDHQDQS